MFNFRGARNDLRYRKKEVCDADPTKNEIAATSPLAMYIIGKSINDEVSFDEGRQSFKIKVIQIKKKVI